MAVSEEVIRIRVDDRDVDRSHRDTGRFEQSLRRLSGMTISPRVSLIDRATAPLQSLARTASNLGRQVVSVPVRILDQATAPLRAIARTAADMAKHAVTIPVKVAGGASAVASGEGAAGSTLRTGLAGFGLARLLPLAGPAGGVAAIGVGVHKALTDAGDLEQIVANISTLKPEIDTSAMYHQLEEISKRVPQTAEQIGAAVYDIVSSIDITAEGALELVEKFARGATGAVTDPATFGTAILGAMNAYRLSVKDADHLTDLFFNTVNKGVISGEELARNLGGVTQSGKGAGVSPDELFGLIAGVTKEGGVPSVNVNNLDNFLQKIVTSEAATELKKVNVQVADAKGNIRPVLDILGDLSKRLDGMTEAGRAAALQNIFPDMQARKGAQVLMSQLDFVRETIRSNREETGQATAAYEKMVATFNSQSKILGNVLTTLFTTIGARLLPVITPLVAAFSQWLPQAFAATDRTLGLVVDAFKALWEAFTGDAGAIGVVYDVIRALFGDSVADFLQPFLQWFMESIPKIKTFISDMGAIFSNVGLVVQKVLSGDFSGALATWYTMLSAVGAKLWPILQGWGQAFIDWVVQTAPLVLAELGRLGQRFVSWVQSEGPKLWAELQFWGRMLVSWISPMIPPLLAEAGRLAGQLGNWITGTAAPWLWANLQAWGQAFVGWVAPYIPVVLQAAQGLIAQLVDWVQVNAPLLVAQLQAWGKAFVDWLAPQIPPLLAQAGVLLGQLGEWISTNAPIFAERFMAWAAAWVDWLAPQIPPLLGKAGELLGELIGWIIGTGLPAIIGKLAEWAGAFWGWVKDVAPKLVTQFGQLLIDLGTWFASTGVPWFLEQAGKLGTALVTGIVNALSGLGAGIEKGLREALSKIDFQMGPFRVNASGFSIGAPNVTLPGSSGDAGIQRLGGGPITEPVYGIGLKTGRSWSFAEDGRTEWVTPHRERGDIGAQGQGGASVTVHAAVTLINQASGDATTDAQALAQKVGPFLVAEVKQAMRTLASPVQSAGAAA